MLKENILYMLQLFILSPFSHWSLPNWVQILTTPFISKYTSAVRVGVCDPDRFVFTYIRRISILLCHHLKKKGFIYFEQYSVQM